MSERLLPVCRFLIRMGGIGWMVYDRDRRGPKLIGHDVAANLTKEQAERALHALTGPAEEPESSPSRSSLGLR